ncbi:VG15 protein [Streptomyces apocyni]|uniref:VG15 protein n=1 Tax=Streptomyces apocyni TaxID=2654677 RepID=UPI0012EA5FBC|nr:hypothetical protein [Streptomyces apocyni]
MSPTPSAIAHAEARLRLAAAASRAARRIWLQVDRDDLYESWLGLLTSVLTVVAGGQLAAAQAAEPWLEQLLGGDPERPEGDRLDPAALVGVDGSGRPLAGVLMAPVWSALRLVTQGAPVAQGMARGQMLLDLVVRTAVADAGRAADSVAMISRPGVTSYVRVLEGGSCSRCLVLAGREYSVSSGFQRHPRCDCGMEPVTRTHRPTPVDARDVYDQMSTAERDKTFGKDAVKAIAAGADIAQVVNARRGMATATVFGRRVQATSEGITRRGLAGRRLRNFQKQPGQRYRVSQTPRLMPEQIMRLADDRAHAVRLLRQHAYIL